jgi:hypothetical protein
VHLHWKLSLQLLWAAEDGGGMCRLDRVALAAAIKAYMMLTERLMKQTERYA